MKNSNKFAIVVDTNEKATNLLDVIKELCLVEKRHRKVELPLLKTNALVVFDKKSTYDFEVDDDPNTLILDCLEDVFKGKSYKLSSDLDKIIDEVYLFAGKEKKKKDMTINITISRPAQKKHKVRVFTNFVKVGWDQYSIKHDSYTGYEYVIIKGNRYEVVRDIFGKGYLVEI